MNYTKEFCEGWYAWHNESDLCCPYKQATAEWFDWHAGWSFAREQARVQDAAEGFGMELPYS